MHLARRLLAGPRCTGRGMLSHSSCGSLARGSRLAVSLAPLFIIALIVFGMVLQDVASVQMEAELVVGHAPGSLLGRLWLRGPPSKRLLRGQEIRLVAKRAGAKGQRPDGVVEEANQLLQEPRAREDQVQLNCAVEEGAGSHTHTAEAPAWSDARYELDALDNPRATNHEAQIREHQEQVHDVHLSRLLREPFGQLRCVVVLPQRLLLLLRVALGRCTAIITNHVGRWCEV